MPKLLHVHSGIAKSIDCGDFRSAEFASQLQANAHQQSVPAVIPASVVGKSDLDYLTSEAKKKVNGGNYGHAVMYLRAIIKIAGETNAVS